MAPKVAKRSRGRLRNDADSREKHLMRNTAVHRSVTALFLVVTAMFGAVSALASEPPPDLGLDLIPSSKKVGEHRYESPPDSDATPKGFEGLNLSLKKLRVASQSRGDS